jgi:hypothetical protein
LNAKKANKIIRNHLHQIDALFVRSEEEATALAARCRVSARALVMRAEAKSVLPAEAWSGFYRALDAQDRRASGHWREKAKDALRAIRRHGKLALAGVIFALALAFFTLVPAGRAIAEGIFHYVIAVFDKQLEIEQANEKQLYEERGYDVPEEMPAEAKAAMEAGGELALESEPVFYESIAAFEAVYSLDAFAFSSDRLTFIEAIETDHLFTGKSLRSHYRTADEKSVTVIEQWYKGDGQSVGIRGEVMEQTVLDGRTMLYVIDTKNGSFDGFVLLDNSVLTIYADAGVELALIWELLK